MLAHENSTDLIKDHKLYKANDSKSVSSNEVVTIGSKVKVGRVILGIAIVILVALLMTGFGYQPWWVFALVVLFGVFITLPVCFDGYWQVDHNGVTEVSYSSNDVEKLGQLLNIRKKFVEQYSYDQIQRAEITYRKKARISPWDFNPDFLKLNLTVDGKLVQLELGNVTAQNLIKIVEMLNANGVDVYDEQEVLQLLKEDKNLFEHFHNGKWAAL